MASKQGGGTLDQQKAKLADQIGAERVEKAKLWIQEDPDAVRYAFKCLSKHPRKEGLSKKDTATFEQLMKINQKVAETWKSERLAEKSK